MDGFSTCIFTLIVIAVTIPSTVRFAHAQLGIIQSVSSYSSCQASPIGASSDDACAMFDDQQEVVVIRAQVRPSSKANVQNLVFQLRDVPDVGDTRTYTEGDSADASLACQGLPIGAQCNVSNSVLVVSFDATRLFAGYQLQQQMESIPACYSVQAVNDLLNNCSTSASSGADICTEQKRFVTEVRASVGLYTEQPCSTLGGISTMGSLDANLPIGGRTEASACPTRLVNDAANDFYEAPQSNTIYKKDGTCPLLYCRVPSAAKKGQDTWSLSVPLPVAYQCSVFDIQPTAQGIMAADVVVTTFDYDSLLPTSVPERLQVSTLTGGRPVGSNTAPVAAKLLRINKGLGVAGPIVLGKVITCNSGGPSNQNPQMMTDAPGRLSPAARQSGLGTVRDDYYNPYTETNLASGNGQSRNVLQRCTLPVAACRRMMLPQWYKDEFRASVTPGLPSTALLPVGHYYIVTQNRLGQYGEECDQNGMDPAILFRSQAVLTQFCVAQVAGGSPKGQCIPGYSQNDASRTGTPVLANADHATYLATIGASAVEDGEVTVPLPLKTQSVPSVDYMPLDYLPLNPNYWLANNMLMREGLFGSSTEVSMDIMIVVQRSTFLGQVTARSSGTFVDSGMSCDATTSGSSRVAWTTQNLGTIGGEYYVVPNFTLPADADSSTQLSVELDRRTFNVGGGVYVDISVFEGEWESRNSPSGGREQASFAYTYNGPFVNSLQVTLDLYIPAGGNGKGFVKVSSITTACTITRGVVEDLAQRSPGGKADYTQDLSQNYQCLYWYNNIFRCWGHYDRKWKLFVNLLLTSAVGIAALLALLSGIYAVLYAWLKPSKTMDIKRSDLDADSFDK